MNALIDSGKSWIGEWLRGWNCFWFAGSSPGMLGVMRVLTGSLVLYTLMVWTFDFEAFLGGGILSADYRQLLWDDPAVSMMAWSHFDWTPDWLRMPVHVLGMLTVLLWTLGVFPAVTGWLTAALVISYSNRATGALFGLDQILAFLTLYLAIGRSGDAFSIVQWWRKRQATSSATAPQSPLSNSWRNTVATRMLQIHLCVVYLFAGLGKFQGEKWLDGEAIWGALASHEYQTANMLWMADHMWLVALLTTLTLFWEVGYAALIWPRLTRPIMLAMAVPMHLGIGLCMGMMEFGLAMLVANMAFLPVKGQKSVEANA